MAGQSSVTDQSTWRHRLLVAAYTRTPERPRRAVVRLVTPGYRVGVLAAVTRPDGRLLLVDQPYVEGWSLPGGDLKRGETVAAALARELREEVGLDLRVETPTLACVRPDDRWVTFVAPLEVGDEAADRVRAASAELTAVAWWPPDALPALDAHAVAPLLLAGFPTRSRS